MQLLQNEQQFFFESVPLTCRRGGIPRGPGLHHLPHLYYRSDPAPISYFFILQHILTTQLQICTKSMSEIFVLPWLL
jgi:hypothetical protein